MKKTLITIVIVIMVALGIYAFFARSNNSVDQQATTSTDVSQASTSDTALSALDRENNSDNFTAVDSSFNADVNAAAQ